MAFTLQTGEIKFKNNNSENPQYQNSLNIFTDLEAIKNTQQYLNELETEELEIINNINSYISLARDAADEAASSARRAENFTPEGYVALVDNVGKLQNMVAPVYSASSTYAVDDYVTKDGYLYRCTTAISTAEAWTAGHWNQVSISKEIVDVSDTITDIANLDVIQKRTYLHTAHGVMHGRNWDNGAESNAKTAYLTEKQYPGAAGIDYYFDDTVYKAIACIYNSDGSFGELRPDKTGSVWVTQSPFRLALTAQEVSGNCFCIVEIRRHDGGNVAENALDTLIWTVTSVQNYPLRSSISDLQDRLDGAETEILQLSGELETAETLIKSASSTAGMAWSIEGYIDKTSIAWVLDGNYRCSKPLPCWPGTQVTLYGKTTISNACALIAFFDKDLNGIEAKNNLGADFTEVDVTVPDGAVFFRLSTHKDYTDKTYYLYKGTTNAPLYQLYKLGLENNAKDETARSGIAALSGKLLDAGKFYGIESSTFPASSIGIDDTGYIYRSSDLPTTHQNYVWLADDGRPIRGLDISINYKTTSDRARITFAYSNGKMLVFQLYRASNGNFVMDCFDEATSAMDGGGSTVVKNNVIFNTGVTLLRFRQYGHTLFVYIGDVFAYTYDRNIVGNIIRVGVNFRGSGTQSYYGKYKLIYRKPAFAHMSLDDQYTALQDITNNSYTSVFESPYFAPLKALHDEYGCKFTLMLFASDTSVTPTWSLSNVTANYAAEFLANSHWLKFAYHGPDLSTYPNTMTISALIMDMQTVYRQIARFASAANIDRCPRMSYFSATKEQVLAMKTNGVICGLLTADDDRQSNSGLNSVELSILQRFDTYTDFEHGISYFRTEERLDTANYETDQQVIDNLNAKWDSAENHEIFILFGHSINTTAMMNRFKAVAEWVNKKGLAYEYPMDMI